MTSDADTQNECAVKIETERNVLPTSEDDIGSRHSCTTSRKRQIIMRLLLFVVIGITSLILSLTLAHHVLNINLPRTLEDIQTIAKQLEEMTDATWADSLTVAGVFSILYLWQQAFSIPGSILFNLLYGYLYNILFASLWSSFLTAAGATLAYGLSMLIAEPFLQLNWVSRRVTMLTSKMRKDRTRSVGLFWWLLFVRLFPFTPYWFINMVSPFLGIPVSPFFWSTFFGSMPYNFISAQAGQVLGELTSTADVFSISLILKLLVVSFVSLVPVIWGDKLKNWIRQFIVKDNDDYEKLEKDADDRLELDDINVSIRS